MFSKKQAHAISAALLDTQTYALNSKAKPIPRRYRFPSLEIFEPYQRQSILAESQQFAIRQPKLILAVLIALICSCLTAYLFWLYAPQGARLAFLPAVFLINIPLFLVKRKIMSDYVNRKAATMGCQDGDAQ